MGRVLARGILAKDSQAKIVGSTHSHQTSDRASAELGIQIERDNVRLAQRAQTLLLCVKPHQAHALVGTIAPVLTREHLLISICASVTIEDLRTWSGGRCAIIRAMPNTPCQIGEGMTVLAGGEEIDEALMARASRIFDELGRTVFINESLMDGATGLSGCGPAYAYLIIEALSDAGVKLGIPRVTATAMAAQTLLGAAKMLLERGVHPASLRDEVTTPAGCTIDGLMAMEEGRLRSTLMNGVVAAAERSRHLREGS